MSEQFIKASEQFATCKKQGCLFATRKHVVTAELGAQLSAPHQHQFYYEHLLVWRENASFLAWICIILPSYLKEIARSN